MCDSSVELRLLKPQVTRRAVLDPSRRCALRCDFCYYLHGDMKSIRPLDDMLREVDAALTRGDVCADITGGEPLQYPYIAELVQYAETAGLRCRIISSLIGPPVTFYDVLQAGVSDWLISMHGAKDKTHNDIVHVPRARMIQIARLATIIERAGGSRRGFCCNYVLVRKNQSEILAWAKWIAEYKPRIVNFINFNPHYQWRYDTGEMRKQAMRLVVQPHEAAEQLDAAIDVLEDSGCGVNVRYWPMCCIREDHRRCVCNDLHVAFDSGEWSNAIRDKRPETGYEYGFKLSLGNEEHGEPCKRCAIQQVCGGANKHWHAISTLRDGEMLRPVTGEAVTDHYFYRRFNAAGMA